MSPPGSSLHIWDGFLLFSAFETVNTFHAHYAASIVIATENEIRIEDRDGRRTVHDALLIPPNFPHRLSAINTNVLVLQIDPNYDEYEALPEPPDVTPLTLNVDSVQNLKERILALQNGELDCTGALDFFHEILHEIAPTVTAPARHMDERVTRILEHLRDLEELPEDISTLEMAALVQLSEDRLRTIFKEHMGLPFRRYLLWLRLRRAVFLLSDGVTLTEAAHAAGFYDSAHFSRTFKEMFGHAPSALLGRQSRVKIYYC